jgi:homoserine acetyltransferase
VGEGEGGGSNVGLGIGEGVADGEGVRDGRGVASATVKRARVSTATVVEKLGVEEGWAALAGSSVGGIKSVAAVGGGE